MISQYYIKTEQFEGPFVLLLELIEKDKLDITRLSLAKVADDYLAYVEGNDRVDLANLSEFLLVASQLILLKSKALLPLFEFTKEEEEEIGNLEERLKEYQRYKKLAGKLNELFLQRKRLFSREEEYIRQVVFTPPKLKAEDLRELFVRVVAQIPQKEELAKEVMHDVVSLEEKIGQLRTTLETRVKMAFHETVRDAKDKIEVIVTFLAMLEMVKQKFVCVQQTQLFGDIMIEKAKAYIIE